MRNKIVASLAAGAILVGAGFVTAAVSSPGAAIAQEVEEADAEHVARGFAFLGEVLDSLVADGDLSAEDAETVLDAVAEAIEEKKEEREALREAIKEAFEDGELTVAEASILPDDHWLFSAHFDDAWEDGVLTTEEIRENRPHPRREAFRKGFRHGAGFGMVMDDGGMDQAEWDEIPEDSRIKNSEIADAIEAELAEDGLVTPEELREIWQAHKESMES